MPFSGQNSTTATLAKGKRAARKGNRHLMVHTQHHLSNHRHLLCVRETKALTVTEISAGINDAVYYDFILAHPRLFFCLFFLIRCNLIGKLISPRVTK